MEVRLSDALKDDPFAGDIKIDFKLPEFDVVDEMMRPLLDQLAAWIAGLV